MTDCAPLQMLVYLADPPVQGHLGQHGQLLAAATFLRLVFIGTGSVAAGIALLRPVAGVSPRVGRFWANGCAVIAGVTGLLTTQLGTAPVAPVVVCSVALLALPLLSARSVVAAAGAGATAAVTLAMGVPAAAGPRYAVAAQVLAAAVWLGTAALVAATPAASRGDTAARLARWTLVPVAWTVVLGALALPSRIGFLLLTEALIVSAVAAAVRRPALVKVAPKLAPKVAPMALAVATAAGTVVTALPQSASALQPAVPLLSRVELAGQAVPILVVPQRPGWNLVHIGAEYGSAGPDRAHLTAATTRPGTSQSWVAVNLPRGRSTLWIAIGGAVGSVPVDTGPATSANLVGAALAGADGPECASAAIGTLVAGVTRRLDACPADRLSPEDGAALRSIVRFIATRGERTVALVGDSSPRGSAAVREVRAAADQAGVTVTAPGPDRVPLIVVSGWAAADTTLQDVGTGRTAANGTYLAPWLLSGPLLSYPAAQLIPLRFDPHDLLPLRYVDQLNARFPDMPATAGGYTTWRAARGKGEHSPLQLYAASTIFIPGIPATHHHTAATWLPGGTLVAVSGPLDER